MLINFIGRLLCAAFCFSWTAVHVSFSCEVLFVGAEQFARGSHQVSLFFIVLWSAFYFLGTNFFCNWNRTFPRGIWSVHMKLQWNWRRWFYNVSIELRGFRLKRKFFQLNLATTTQRSIRRRSSRNFVSCRRNAKRSKWRLIFWRNTKAAGEFPIMGVCVLWYCKDYF